MTNNSLIVRDKEPVCLLLSPLLKGWVKLQVITMSPFLFQILSSSIMSLSEFDITVSKEARYFPMHDVKV